MTSQIGEQLLWKLGTKLFAETMSSGGDNFPISPFGNTYTYGGVAALIVIFANTTWKFTVAAELITKYL